MSEELLFMSTWYERLRDLTIPARRIELDPGVEDLMLAMHLDALNARLDPVECVGIVKMFLENERYRKLLDPLMNALSEEIERCGAVFVRGDIVAPRDACRCWYYDYLEDAVRCGVSWLPNAPDVCLVSNAVTGLALLVASNDVIDLGVSFGRSNIVWIRSPRRLLYEMRIFVYGNVPRLVSWRSSELPRSLDDVIRVVRERYLPLMEEVSQMLQASMYVADVALVASRSNEAKAVVVDIAPFPGEDPFEGIDTDPLLYRGDFWNKLYEAVEKNAVLIRAPLRRTEVQEVVVELKA